MTTETKSASLARLSRAERNIILTLLDAVTARGLTVSIFDGEAWSLKIATDRDAIEAEIAATDETRLTLRDPADPQPIKHRDGTVGRIVGSIWLIHGNDADVIADHSDNPTMREILAPAEQLREDLCSYAASKGLQR